MTDYWPTTPRSIVPVGRHDRMEATKDLIHAVSRHDKLLQLHDKQILLQVQMSRTSLSSVFFNSSSLSALLLLDVCRPSGCFRKVLLRLQCSEKS